MNQPQLLDCSLRDGGYLTNHSFADGEVEDIILNLTAAGVRFIEVGYFQRNDAGLPPRLGASSCDAPYLERCARICHSSNTAVMVRINEAQPALLKDLPSMGVSLVRMPVTGKSLPNVEPYVEVARRAGLQIALNIVRASELDNRDLNLLAARLVALDPDFLYLADSNGSMRPASVHRAISCLASAGNLRTVIGFHPHDSLSLGLANALEAVDAGATLIDGSLGGMGKGGNVATELLAMALPAISDCRIDLGPLVGAVRRCIVPHVGRSPLVRVENALAATMDVNQGLLASLKARAAAEGRLLVDVLLDEYRLGAWIQAAEKKTKSSNNGTIELGTAYLHPRLETPHV